MLSSPRQSRRVIGLGAAVLTLAGFASPVGAQMPATLEPDPDEPVKEGFDLDRVILWERPNFTPLRNPEWLSLAEARRSGDVDDGTVVLAFEEAGRTYTLVSSQMSYHHVAQGEIAGEPWMVTF